jgi:hypothetical protein
MSNENTGTAGTTNTAQVAAVEAYDHSKTYNEGDKFMIKFNDKPAIVTFVRPGVVQKTATIYYIRDCVSGEWLYCFPQRLTTMISKGIDLANYKGRESRAADRKAAKAQKLIDQAARAKAAEEAAKASLLMVQTTPGPQQAAPEAAPEAAPKAAPKKAVAKKRK